MSNGLGKTFIPSPGASFRQSAADFSLGAADFETKIRIPDKSAKTAGIFVLPVASQTAYGSDGKMIDTFILHAAVAVDEKTMITLQEKHFTNHTTLMAANNIAKIYNNDEYARARKLSGITSLKREDIDLVPLLSGTAPKTGTALSY